ncbi:MAG: DNA-binding response regulator [Bacilli bacterium]|nr:DNA-binding response regulator [Bacilli bacterium]
MRLLAVEDDAPLLDVIVKVLEDESYKVDRADTGTDGLFMAEQGIYDLLILDIMLPGVNGISIVKQLRAKSILTPILLLTARDTVEDRVKGLDAGADDYLIKPFAVAELLARTRALLRRQGKAGVEGEMAYGPIYLRSQTHEGYINDEPLNLTIKEYELLEFFLRNREQILTRDQIFDRIWGFGSEAISTVVDVYVHYLRKKLAAQGCDQYIRTVRGVGYMLKEGIKHVQENSDSVGSS